MTGHATLARALIALVCLAAAGCARMADEQAQERAQERAHEAATPAEPAAAVTPLPATVGAASPEPPLSAPVTPLADSARDSIDRRSLATGVETPPPAAPNAEISLATTELGVVAPAGPATRDPDGAPDVSVSSLASPLSTATLDFTSLVARLRKTKAINLRTKLAVKNESDDLLDGFRAYHTQHGAATLADLRRSYDSLFLKLKSLLQDADPPLALEIDRSRGAIWEILADPAKFSAWTVGPRAGETVFSL